MAYNEYAVRRSHVFGVVPRQEVVDLALLVDVVDGSEYGFQVGMRLNCVNAVETEARQMGLGENQHRNLR